MSVLDDFKKWLKGATQEEKSDFMSQLSKEKELFDMLKAMGFTPDIAKVSEIGVKTSPVDETKLDATGQPQKVDLVASEATINAIIMSGTVTANIGTAPTLNINVVSAITLNVNITNATLNVSGSVTITSGTVNIQTSAGTNIIIDKLTQSAYVERRSTIQNDATANGSWAKGVYWLGKWFPRGCRGLLLRCAIELSETSGNARTVTVYFAPYFGAKEVFSVTISLPANQTQAYINSNYLLKMWNYDSLLVFVKNTEAGTNFFRDTSMPQDSYYSSDSGVTWVSTAETFHFRVEMSGQTIGDLPVSGVVNVIPFPNDASVGRPAWYDRNPVPQTRFWQATVGKHDETERWTYTVPSGKKAFVEAAAVNMVRTSDGTNAAVEVLCIRYTPNGGNMMIVLSAMLDTAATTSQLQDSAFLGHSLTMLAGDTLDCHSWDKSTGTGETYMIGGAKIMEYDA